MLTIRYLKKFKRDLKRLQRQGKDMEKFKAVVRLLCEGKELPPKYADHPLKGDWSDFRDCHIEPDWVLIYRIEQEELLLVLARSGSHSELDL